MRSRFFVLFLMLIGFQVGAPPVDAMERLNFETPIARSSLENIRRFYASQGRPALESMRIAKVDLNDDGLYEFFVVDSACTDEQVCNFEVVGEDGHRIQSYGMIKARGILVGREHQNDMRTLLVYNNQVNDFDYAVYSWHPELAKYDRINP